MALATRVACNTAGNGDRGKSNGNEFGGQVTAMRAMAAATAPMWAMVTEMRLAGKEEGKGEGDKGNGDSNEGGRRQRGQRRQGNGDGNKGGGQADSEGNKESNFDGKEGGGQGRGELQG
jgi:hypothetical protein